MDHEEEALRWSAALSGMRDMLAQAGMPPDEVDDMGILRGVTGAMITEQGRSVTLVRQPQEVRAVAEAMAWAYRRGLRS